MRAVAVLSWAGAAAFCAVGILASLRWWHERTRAAGAIAVAFVLLAFVRVADVVTDVTGQPAWLGPFVLVAFAGVGYAALEHRACLFGLATKWRVTAAVLLSSAAGALLLTASSDAPDTSPSPLQVVAALTLVCVWSACLVEAAWRLRRAADATATVQSAQLRLLSASYVGLAVVVVGTIVLASQADPPAATQVVSDLASSTIAIVLYASLQAPPFLRRYWLHHQSEKLGQQLQPVPRWYIDLDTNAVWWSQALRRLLGVDGKEPATFTRFLELTHEHDRGAARAAVERQLTEHTAVQTTLRVVRASDGETRWLKTTSDVLMDLEGRRPVGLYGTVSDITAFKLAEERLEDALRTAEQATEELSTLTAQFEYQSLHDPLTGLANRVLCLAQLDQAWAHQQRSGRDLVVLAIDLDGFKTVNDCYGHHAGDELLQAVADRLRRCIRGGDTLARMGGDEFTVILPDATLAEAEGIATRVHDEVTAPLVLAGAPQDIAASVGIAWATQRQSGPADLLREADAALYAAKSAGKGRYALYSDGLPRAASVTLTEIPTDEARAWADYMRRLRTEIADRKSTGHISPQLRAPEGLHRTLQRILVAIQQLHEDQATATIILPARHDLQEFVFHQTAVQHWADALVTQGLLMVRRSPAAGRFWMCLERAAAQPEHPLPTAGGPRRDAVTADARRSS